MFVFIIISSRLHVLLLPILSPLSDIIWVSVQNIKIIILLSRQGISYKVFLGKGNENRYIEVTISVLKIVVA